MDEVLNLCVLIGVALNHVLGAQIKRSPKLSQIGYCGVCLVSLEGSMNRIALMGLVVLSLPILFFVYQPGWDLGSFERAVVGVGKTLSPIILFSALWYTVRREWNN